MKKKSLSIICLLLFIWTSFIIAYAHPGKTDANGGHYDRSSGEYHYHHGYSAHQHIDGQCPYDFDDATENTYTSSKLTQTSTHNYVKESTHPDKIPLFLDLFKPRTLLICFVLLCFLLLRVLSLHSSPLSFLEEPDKNSSEHAEIPALLDYIILLLLVLGMLTACFLWNPDFDYVLTAKSSFTLINSIRAFAYTGFIYMFITIISSVIFQELNYLAIVVLSIISTLLGFIYFIVDASARGGYPTFTATLFWGIINYLFLYRIFISKKKGGSDNDVSIHDLK